VSAAVAYLLRQGKLKMAVKLSSLKADLDKERKGTWQQALSVIPDPDVKFLVSSIHLPAYSTARNIAYQRLARIHKGNVPDEALVVEVGRLFAEHILHDWQGLADDDGKPIPYSKDLALRLLTDPANRELVRAVEQCAGEAARIDVQFVEEEIKNSGKPSARV
jgi:hypothetical protein